MSDEVQEVLAEVPAPEQVGTTTPEPVASESEAAPEAAKVFTQEELDAAIGKRLAVAQRKWEREQAQRQQESQQLRQPPAEVKPEQFNSTDEYVEALAARKAEELVQRREAQRHQQAVLETYHEKEEAAFSKYEDFQQVAYNPNLKISEVMAQTIQASDIGPDIAYHLGTNPKEAERISRLPPFLQAKELGRIEAQIAATPPTTKKTSSAPAPISPVTAKSTGGPSFDTTDPRSIKSMSTSEWIAAERQREMKRAEARQLR